MEIYDQSLFIINEQNPNILLDKIFHSISKDEAINKNNSIQE